MVLVAAVIVLLQLINIGSSTALFAILGVSTIALYISYILPIVFITLAKIRGDHIPFGPFRMGKFGLAVNIFAIIYGIFVLIWLPFPPLMPVTGVNMNYAGPIMGAVLIFALLDWCVTGRKRFKAPVEAARSYDS